MTELQRLTKVLYGIRGRCNNKNDNRYKFYGGKGVKCLITAKELVLLWKRDNAHKLKKPSIDRIDSNGHYQFKNCRFIELADNSRRTFKTGLCRNGHKQTDMVVHKKGNRTIRECRICRNASIKRHWAKNKDKYNLQRRLKRKGPIAMKLLGAGGGSETINEDGGSRNGCEEDRD